MDEEISGSLMSVMFRMNVTTDEWLLSQGGLVHEKAQKIELNP